VPVSFPVKSFPTPAAGQCLAIAPDGKTFGVGGANGTAQVFPLGEEKGAIELKGHTGPVTRLATNGATWVSAGSDKTIRLWAVDGKQTGQYALGPLDVLGMVLGQSVYTTSADGVLRTWPLQVQPVRSLPTQKEFITAFNSSGDGNTLVFATADRTIAIGSTANNAVAASFPGPKIKVEVLSLSPDGVSIVAGSLDGSLAIWDRAGKAKGELAAHEGAITAAMFHPSQPFLLSAGVDGKVKAWNLPLADKQPKDKALKAEIKAHSGRVTGLQIHLATGQIVTAGDDKLIRFWDLAKPEKAVREIGPLTAGVNQMALSRDGQVIAAAVGKAVVLLNSQDGKEVGRLPQSAEVTALSFSADKARLLIGRADDFAVLTEVATGVVVQSFPHAHAVPGLFVHPALPQVVTASSDKTVTVSPVAVQRAVAVGVKASHLSISPGLDRLVTSGPGQECVSWLTGNGQKEKSFATGGEALCSAFSKDGQRVAVSGADQTVKLYTMADGKLMGAFPAGGKVTEMAFHPTLPILAGIIQNKVVAWSIAFVPGQPVPPEFGKTIQEFPHAKNVNALAFNAEGLLNTAGDDPGVRRFRIASDAAVKNFGHPNLVDSAAFDDTGSRLATGCHDGVLRIWDVPKNTVLKAINAHITTMPQQVQHPIYSVLWTPDFKQIFTASYDRSIKLWDVASGNLVREFKGTPDPKPDEKKDSAKPESVGHRDAVFSIALSKDGKQLASGSSDRAVKLWDVEDGKVIRDFPNPDLKPVLPGEPAPSHPGWVHAVRFTPDGQFLVSAGAAPKSKGYLAVWKVSNGKRVSFREYDFGAIHSMSLNSSGTLMAFGCAPVRGQSEANVIVIKYPEK
jgi:WD40 repeat protein